MSSVLLAGTSSLPLVNSLTHAVFVCVFKDVADLAFKCVYYLREQAVVLLNEILVFELGPVG